MAIHFASVDHLPARPEPRLPRTGQPSARNSRTLTCSRTKPEGAEPRRRGEDCAARNDRVLKLLPLVKRVALQLRRQLPAHVELGDLVSAGSLGLIDAVQKFDPRKGVTIETYARLRIRGAILDALRGDDPASRDMRRKIKRIEEVSRGLAFRLERPPGDAELARAMGLSLAGWHRLVSELQQLGVEGVGAEVFREVRQRVDEVNLADPSAQDPYALCYRREQFDLLNRALRCLSERERVIMKSYYQELLTMKQIGARLGIDESRVSQIHSAAVARLQVSVSSALREPRSTLPRPSAAAQALGSDCRPM